MTIWQIIIYWLISEVLVWGLWWIVVKKAIVSRLDAQKGFKLCTEMDNYPKTQSKAVEWLRFVVWPYGVIQRTVLLMKMRKRLIDGN